MAASRHDLRRKFHALLALLEWQEDKEAILLRSSGGRTSSTKDIALKDFGRAIDILESLVAEHLTPSRNKVTYYLRELNMEIEGKADYARIENFIQNIGSRNPRKVRLFQLRRSELNAVLTQVEAMYKKEVRKASAKTKPTA